MTTKKITKLSSDGLECLKKAVIEELTKKAALGQYAIINRGGKACKVPAKEALEIAVKKI